jgi:hypothetical protein
VEWYHQFQPYHQLPQFHAVHGDIVKSHIQSIFVSKILIFSEKFISHSITIFPFTFMNIKPVVALVVIDDQFEIFILL